MSGELGLSVCVVGTGAAGLTVIKNFVEEGFEVTAFERNSHVGGVWRHNNDPNQTSVLKSTLTNVSKYGACFSDFPYPDDAPLHPTGLQTAEYLDSYADHFKLRQYIRFSTQVVGIERDECIKRWIVKTRNTSDESQSNVEVHYFHRLVLATGPHTKRVMPAFPDEQLFKGQLIHSMQFKDAKPYSGKTVVVLGSQATAVDIIECLRQAGAKKIYMSHRRSFRLLPRIIDGKPADVTMTRRYAVMGSFMRTISPAFAEKMGAGFMSKVQRATWPGLENHPAFSSARRLPSMSSSTPVLSDDIARNLLDGTAESVQGIERFSGPRSVTLTDGSVLDDVDVVICCTGAVFDYKALLPADCDPTNPDLAPAQSAALQQTKYYREGDVVAHSYRKFLSIQHPHSLAFLGTAIYRRGAPPWFDLIAMALAQLWKGSYPMPSRAEMRAEAEASYHSVVKEFEQGEFGRTGLQNSVEFDQWLQKVAGCGVWERLGWGWQGWSFWWNDRKLYSMLMDGVDSPHSLRLFETDRGRKTWPGAMEAIEKANRDVNERHEKWKKEQLKLKQ